MKLSLIKKDQFALWLQMRREVYGSLSDGFHEQEMALIFERKDWFCYFFTDANEQILGFVELSARNVADACVSSPVAYIEGLYLKKEYRGMGLGSKAIATILAWCKEKAYTELATDAELVNVDAKEFFKAVGFKESFRIIEFHRRVE